MRSGSQRRRRQQRNRRARSVADSVDILTEILIRLPVKTVIRFQCVSKHLLSVISAADFRWKHIGFRHIDSNINTLYFRHKMLNNQLVVSLSGGGPTRIPPVPFLDSAEFFVMAHSCNGLLLCRTKHDYVVCNPTTQSHVAVPIQEHTGIEAYLAFDPLKSPFFKIVILDHHMDHCDFRIYCSEKKSWKELRVDASYQSFYDFYLRGVFWNGALHWVIDENYSVFRFDAHAEKPSEFLYERCSSPSYGFSSSRFRALSDEIWYFGECRDQLVLVVSGFDALYNELTIFEMGKDYTSWSKMCTINLNCVLASRCSSEAKTGATVMCVLKAAEEDGYELVLGDYDHIVLYNTELNSSKLLHHKPDIKLRGFPVFGYCDVFPLVRCLLPLELDPVSFNIEN